ncbi:MAG: hypothetical protein ACK2U1_21390 [Anaerolineales bacterium]
MVRIEMTLLGLVLLLGIPALASCSSIPASPTFSSTDRPGTQPAAVTAPAERDLPTSTEPVETSTKIPPETAVDQNSITTTPTASAAMADTLFAEVLSVDVSGDENAYQLLVEIRSPDTGCEQYADWWEVVSQDGDLLYRRILLHSHVSEQPFKRSGGPVAIGADTSVIVRAHMHPHGFGGMALRGSVEGGFEPVQLDANFAPNLDEIEPLPTGCAF